MDWTCLPERVSNLLINIQSTRSQRLNRDSVTVNRYVHPPKVLINTANGEVDLANHDLLKLIF